MIAARRRKFSNSRLKIFWFFTFLRKKIAEVFRLQTIYYVRPLPQINTSWRPQNKWGPPWLTRWRWDLEHFRELLQIPPSAGEPCSDTNSEHLKSATAATSSAVSKKNWPPPKRVLNLIILGRLSKLFSKIIRGGDLRICTASHARISKNVWFPREKTAFYL